jgi:RNA-binding protein
MTLTSKEKSYLRSLAHKLSPAVQIGKAGLTAALTKEIDRNLADHELIKVRVGGEDRHDLLVQSEAIAESCNAELVQVIGHIAVLYRQGDDPAIELSQPRGKPKEDRATGRKTVISQKAPALSEKKVVKRRKLPGVVRRKSAAPRVVRGSR